MMDFVIINTDPNHPQISQLLGLTMEDEACQYFPLKPEITTYDKALLIRQIEEKPALQISNVEKTGAINSKVGNFEEWFN